jgi:hypothetical protein
MGWELLLFACTGAGVLAGCMVPNRWLPPLPNDKLMHFAAFGLLSALALRIAHGWSEAGFWLAGLALAGWLIECLQGLMVADRTFCWRDIAANMAGIGFVTACVGLYDIVS